METKRQGKDHFLRKFRDPEITRKLLGKIEAKAAELEQTVRIMEVCGTHTRAISEYGFRTLLPENVKLLSGPGCPTCVTAQRQINMCLALAEEGVSVASFGDMMRVPGASLRLEDLKAEGAKVRVVESPMEAFDSDVFFAIGFDTTAPNTAVAVKKGLTVLNAHKRFVPAMAALLQMGEIQIDGYLNPGHVSTIIGTRPYHILKVPQVIAGFEPTDVLTAILRLLEMMVAGEVGVENRYKRIVRDEGNPVAQKFLEEVFEVGDADWRGLGTIPGSGFELRKEFDEQNAEMIYSDILSKVDSKELNPGCSCAEVLRGLMLPTECPLFDRSCTPESPQGPCMVSMEGSCGIAYEFREE